MVSVGVQDTDPCIVRPPGLLAIWLFQAGTRLSVLGKIPGKPAGPDGRTQVFLSLNFFKADFANRNAPLSCSRNITKY